MLHHAIITCGRCAKKTTIALGMASAIACGKCGTEIALGEITPPSNNTLKDFKIYNPRTGVDMGVWTAKDKQGALDAMARAAGYKNYAAALCPTELKVTLLAGD